MAVACCTCMPHRYFLVLMCFIGMLISVGYRTSFALVMTHINAVNNSNASSSDSLFPHCTTEGTSRDLVTHWDGSTALLFNTFYFIGQLFFSLPGGALCQKFPAKRIYAITILISSVLQLLLSLVIISKQIWLIYLFRLVQGGVESITVPSMNAVISAWAPKNQKTTLMNLAYAGVYLSPAVANFSTGASVCYLSWDSILYIYGSLGVLWSVFFYLFVYQSPDQHPCLCDSERDLFIPQANVYGNAANGNAANGNAANGKAADQKTPWCKFFTSMPVWAMFVGAFCRNFVFAMLITEVQQYYKDVYSLNSAMNGLLNGLPHVFMVIFMLLGSVFLDYLGKHGILSWTLVRKLAQTLGFGVMGVCILVIGFLDNYIEVFVLFCVGVAFSGFSISGYQTNPLDLAPKYVGPLTGISRTGMAGSILSTVLAAKTAGDSHKLSDWQTLFIIGGSLHIAGVIFYCIFASGRQQSWAEPKYEALVGETDETESKENSNVLISPSGINSNYGAIVREIY
uniref:Major facilitator superfamily (MFS) profile domain-containing protein n=1 Tax=Biomphalaria glabrata TaxID=6526 RepID=A0A2C9LAE7_BIOGL